MGVEGHLANVKHLSLSDRFNQELRGDRNTLGLPFAAYLNFSEDSWKVAILDE